MIFIRLVPHAKIAIPELPRDFVGRPGLRSEIDATADATLVCAPAGYGKTVLVADSARTPDSTETAWVSLDPDDNDPRQLWSAVVAAIRGCPSVPASSRLRSRSVWPAGGVPDVLAELVGVLQELPEPIRLVLDDVQVLVEPDTLRGIETFIRNQPPAIRLVLSSRFDPPVGLHRLRLAGRLSELRADRIRLTRDETATLLEKAGVQLSERQVQTLHQRTAGWAAGVRLAALALTTAADRDTVLAEYSGNNRSVADYLVDEVLSGMSEDTLDFLRTTSIVDPIPAVLAAELSGRKAAGGVLDALEHETGMVQAVGLTRDSYHVQPLLRSYLLADLRRNAGPHRVVELHAAAARWWTAEGDPIKALRHAMDSGDASVVRELLRGVGVSLLLTGDHLPLRRGLRGLGPAAVAADPLLSLISALTSLNAGEQAEAQGFLRHALHAWPTDPSGELSVLRSAAEQLGAAGATAVPADRAHRGRAQPDHDLPDQHLPAEPGLEALARLGRGVAWMRGDLGRAEARRELELALSLARRHDLDYLAMQCLELLGVLAGVDGDVRRMHTVSAEAFSAFGEHGWEESAWSDGAAAMLAFVALVRAEPTDAASRAAAALAHDGGRLDPVLRFALRVANGAATVDSGEQARGLAELQRARTEFGDHPASPELLAAAALLECDAGLELGHQAAARTVQGWLADRTAGGAAEGAELHVMRSWAHSAAGRADHARTALRPALDGSAPPLLPYTLVEAWLQETRLAALSGERPTARHALQSALELAEPLDALRPFARAGSVVRELLASQFGGQLGGPVDAQTFAGRALAVERHGSSPFAAVLSERELTVLTMLPSLLSLEEIAGELTVSVNTVKSHVRSIYAKLGVSSRRTAVLTAYEHGLLSRDLRST